MAGNDRPFTSTRAPGAMVASADQLATQAGLAMIALGGNAIDAAIATNAAIAVTSAQLCGLGGDLFALVHDGSTVFALNASGRAGTGADAAALRSAGHDAMPFRHGIESVTVPGCVDGWWALHERFGSLPFPTLLGPSIQLAEEGFPASPLLVGALAQLDERARAEFGELLSQAKGPGDRVRRPGVGRTLRAIAEGGRDAFYLGEFGRGLLDLGRVEGRPDWFTEADLRDPRPDWVEPLSAPAFGRVLHTMPPNSQGYLLLGAASLATDLDLPADPDDPRWAHLLVEAAKAAGRDRPSALYDGADGRALLAAIAARAGEIDPELAGRVDVPANDGDTTYLCTVDRNRMGVSLIQSNASGFGSWIVEQNTGITLHNRGIGFSLEAGHPAELAPGRRPPHTLAPAIATHPDGSLASVFGTMGGDAQPQILLQLAARLFHHGQSPAVAIDAGRWALHGATSGFDTWTSDGGPHLLVEGNAPAGWTADLVERGHAARTIAPYDNTFGHAHAIVVEPDGMLAGAYDPRTRIGSVAGV